MTQHSDADYAAFIDRNIHKFLPKFKFYSTNPVSFHAGWNWSAFLFTFWWYLYRKMYLWAVICFISLMVPYLNIFIWIGWGIAANYLYFKHATEKIGELKAFHGDGYGVYLRDTGGVNSWVPWVAILVSSGFLLVVTLMFMGAMMLAFG